MITFSTVSRAALPGRRAPGTPASRLTAASADAPAAGRRTRGHARVPVTANHIDGAGVYVPAEVTRVGVAEVGYRAAGWSCGMRGARRPRTPGRSPG